MNCMSRLVIHILERLLQGRMSEAGNIVKCAIILLIGGDIQELIYAFLIAVELQTTKIQCKDIIGNLYGVDSNQPRKTVFYMSIFCQVKNIKVH